MIDYVDQQIRHGLRLLAEQTKDAKGEPLPRRSLYGRLASSLDAFAVDQRSQPRWIILTGLRGVGKTTIMAQLYVHLSRSMPADSCNLLYVSLDDVTRRQGGDMNSLLDACELRWGGKLHDLDRPTFLFIDEIQADPRAFEVLKPVYDKALNLFLLCSGSAATNLHIGASVAGRRAQVNKLYPLSFAEHQVLKSGREIDAGLADDLAAAIYRSDSAGEACGRIEELAPAINRYRAVLGGDYESIDKYLQAGGLPFLLDNPSPQAARPRRHPAGRAAGSAGIEV